MRKFAEVEIVPAPAFHLCPDCMEEACVWPEERCRRCQRFHERAEAALHAMRAAGMYGGLPRQTAQMPVPPVSGREKLRVWSGILVGIAVWVAASVWSVRHPHEFERLISTVCVVVTVLGILASRKLPWESK